MLIAKDEPTYVKLQSQFINRTIKKRYLALLDGIVKQPSGFIDLPLRVDLNDRPRQLVCYEHGKPFFNCGV
jgi:tRNA pseudouridine32 synthase/23S rRNA pseudouridine746 synthase